MLARFHETIPTLKSVFVIRDLENKFWIFNRNYNFVTEITILPFFQKLEFLGSYNVNPKSLSVCFIQSTCAHPNPAAMYSASVVDKATEFCFLLCQDTSV